MSRNGTPMDELAVEGCMLRLRVEGDGTKPALVLSHMLGTDLSLWDGLVPAFAEHFRVVRYDTRGHGGSGIGDGAISIERLGRDVLAILDGLEIEKAQFCGVSMGGAVGLWLLAHAPERVERVVIAGSAAKLGTPEIWNGRIAAALAEGLEQAVVPTIERWFDPAFVETAPDEVAAVRAMIRATSAQGYASCCAALRDMDLREAVREVGHSVLVLRGADDPSVPADDAAQLVAAMSGATMLEVEGRHCSPVEAPAAFAAAVVTFLTAETAPRRAAGRRSATTGPAARETVKPVERRTGRRGRVEARRPVGESASASGKAIAKFSAKASATRKTAARTAPRASEPSPSRRRGAAKATPASVETERSTAARSSKPAPKMQAVGKVATSTTRGRRVAPARRAAVAQPAAARARTAAQLRAAAAKAASVKAMPGAAKASTSRAQSKPQGKAAARAVPVGTASAKRASAKAQPAKAQPAKAQPAKAQPAKAQPAKAQPAKAQPAKAQPAKAQPAKAQPAKAQPAKAQPAKAQPAKAQPAKAQPAKAQPAKAQPAKAQPAKAQPAKAQPAKAQPAKAPPAKTPPVKAPVKKASPRPPASKPAPKASLVEASSRRRGLAAAAKPRHPSGRGPAGSGRRKP